MYGWQNKVQEANVVIMTNFQAIGQPIAEIGLLRFNGFQMVALAVRHLGFLNFWIFKLDILTGLL